MWVVIWLVRHNGLAAIGDRALCKILAMAAAMEVFRNTLLVTRCRQMKQLSCSIRWSVQAGNGSNGQDVHETTVARITLIASIQSFVEVRKWTPALVLQPSLGP